MQQPSIIKAFTRWLSQGKRLPLYLGMLTTLLVLWLHVAAPPVLDNLIQRLEYLFYDQRLAIMPRSERPEEHRIVIVDLDERSLQAEGQYPWNRILVGRLVEKLRDAGAVVIGFDITFPEPDRSVRDMIEAVDLPDISADFSETLARIEPQINSDQYFANAMNTVDTVLAINFNPQSDVGYNELPRSVVDVGEELAEQITVAEMSGYTGNIKILQDAAMGNGSMNQQPDSDGVVRRVPLVIRYGSELYPTLSLEMLRVYNFFEEYQLLTQNYDGVEVVTAIQVGTGSGTFVIPTDRLGQVIVPYVGASSLGNNEHFPYVSATDVLRDTLSDEERAALDASMVLVGTSAPGLQDLRATPLQRIYPGVEVHANVLNALLGSRPVLEVGGESSTEAAFSGFRNPDDVQFPYRLDYEAGAMLVLILIMGLIMSVAFPYMGAGSMAATALALLIGAVWSNFQLWSVYKLDFSLVLLLLLIIAVTSVNMVYGFLAESQTRKTIKGMFDQYVPPAHIDSMLDNPDEYGFEGESKELTVLFSDIRSFTTISEALSATQLKKLLNDFFTPITGIIFEHNGTIDKYVGDMVMAFWGAPLDDEEHRRNAVLAALEMLEKVEELKPVFKEQGFPEVNVGVGINTGLMNVGDMGSTYRRSYTVLGDAVNLGSRLEGLTKFYGIKLLVGEETVKGLDGMLLRHIDRVKVKGKDEAVDCFEPICMESSAGEQLKARVADYHKALDHYFAKQWDEAETILKKLNELEHHALLYDVYLERIEHLREVPPPADWDGSFTHTSK